MVIIKVKVTVKSENLDKAKKIGAVLNNIVKNVSEPEMLQIFELLKDKPQLFKNIVNKINNPIFKQFL